MPDTILTPGPQLIVADAFEWGTKVANRYVANFGSADSFGNAVYGDLLDVGWRASSPTAPPTMLSARVGDLDTASDAGGIFTTLTVESSYIASPPVIGGRGLIDAISQVIGTRPTTITAWVSFSFYGTADNSDMTGVGIANDADSSPTANPGRGFLLGLGATNFELWSGDAATDLGVAKDTAQHLLEIEITLSDATFRVLLDGVEVKASAALTQDVWPMCMTAYRGSIGSPPQVFAWGVNYD